MYLLVNFCGSDRKHLKYKAFIHQNLFLYISLNYGFVSYCVFCYKIYYIPCVLMGLVHVFMYAFKSIHSVAYYVNVNIMLFRQFILLLCSDGAAIVVKSPRVSSSFSRQLYNPQCFLQYASATDSPMNWTVG